MTAMEADCFIALLLAIEVALVGMVEAAAGRPFKVEDTDEDARFDLFLFLVLDFLPVDDVVVLVAELIIVLSSTIHKCWSIRGRGWACFSRNMKP